MASRHFRNLGILVRRYLLGLVLLIPQSIRSRLSKSRLLTSIYLFFDHSKYEAVLDPEAWESRRAEEASFGFRRFGHYSYITPNPEFAGRLDDLDGIDGPRFSVIMPVHNTEPSYLLKAINSVREQWYPNWELCLVDDCSERGDTLDILSTIDDPKIHRVRSEENLGIAGASNLALKMAGGDFIVLLDHDD